MNDFYAREFWRFVSVQEEVKKLALTAIALAGLLLFGQRYWPAIWLGMKRVRTA